MKPQPERYRALLLLLHYGLKDFITLSVCQKLLWKNHISFVSVSGDRAYTSLPRHNSPGQHPCAGLSGPAAKPPSTTSTSGSFITLTLAVPSSFAPATVILAGSSLRAGASHGGSRFLNYEPDVSGPMGTQRERDMKRG